MNSCKIHKMPHTDKTMSVCRPLPLAGLVAVEHGTFPGYKPLDGVHKEEAEEDESEVLDPSHGEGGLLVLDARALL